MSLDFVRTFAPHVSQAGYRIGNIDSFVVLGPVKLSPHLAEIRTNLADALGLDEANVSIKSRSNDGLGLEGECAACSAWVSALLYPTEAA